MRFAALWLLLSANAACAEERSESGFANSLHALEGRVTAQNSSDGRSPDFLTMYNSYAMRTFANPFSILLGGVPQIAAPTDGKLSHDMRTFVNITFDWSSRAFDGEGAVVVPQCHEYRLRKSYYQHQVGDLITGESAHSGVRTGHLLYPFLITVVNGSAAEPRKVYYATGVHKLFADETAFNSRKEDEPLIELVLVSKQTWKLVWIRWLMAINTGKDLCDGGPHFDTLIPSVILEKENFKPQYNDLVENYTESTTDVCNDSICSCPQNQAETLTFASPTEEGMQELRTSTRMEDASIMFARMASNRQMGGFLDACYANEEMKKFKQILEAAQTRIKSEAQEIKENRCVLVIISAMTHSMAILTGNNNTQAITNGKLRHDMRTFVNITFDWSSRNSNQQGKVVIPQCHEYRLRKSYYQYQLSAFANGESAFMGVRPGHLVYPFVVTVVNETSPNPLTVYYAVGVHKLFTNGDDMLTSNVTLVDIVMVSKKTWSLVWDRWIVALYKGKKLCDGGQHFDKLIPRINIEKKKLKPQYKDLVLNHTESTTDACGVSSCGCPRNQTETLTFAFPTEEGMDELSTTTRFGPIGNNTLLITKGQTLYRMISFLESCYKSEFDNKLDRELAEKHPIFKTQTQENKENRCIFYPPYC